MRVMVLVKATEESEKNVLPTTAELSEMGTFNEELIKAGVMLAGDGLKPTSVGKRLEFDGSGSPSILDGPFAETKELVAGFWIWDVSSMDEAVQWLSRAPFRGATVELRPFFEPEDFGDAVTPDLQERWDRQYEATGGRGTSGDRATTGE